MTHNSATLARLFDLHAAAPTGQWLVAADYAEEMLGRTDLATAIRMGCFVLSGYEQGGDGSGWSDGSGWGGGWGGDGSNSWDGSSGWGNGGGWGGGWGEDGGSGWDGGSGNGSGKPQS